jgi:serine/threonine protein kinase
LRLQEVFNAKQFDCVRYGFVGHISEPRAKFIDHMPDILCPNCVSLRPFNRIVSPFVCDNCGFEFSISLEKKSESPGRTKRTPSETTSLSRSRTIDESAGPAARSMEESTLRTIGRFELKAVLGRGGFGVVYRAYDPHLERFVALKIPTLGPNQKTKISRFLSEAKAAARLKHANIVSTFESGYVDNKYYIASEFIEGSLLSILIKKKRPTTHESVLMAQKLAKALGYAHSQGIVHRDVKPHNVIIDTDGEPQLMDFGLAKRLDDNSNVTTDGALLGTPAYMSPEQARGEIALVGPASDQYSLGVVLYHLLTGSTPCEGSPHLVISEVAKGELYSVRDVDPAIDSDIAAVCQKAMSPEITNRYATCEDFAEDLANVLAGRPVKAQPLGMIQRARRIVARNQLVVWFSSLSAILFLVVLAFAFKFVQLQRERSSIEDPGVKDAVAEKNNANDANEPENVPPAVSLPAATEMQPSAKVSDAPPTAPESTPESAVTPADQMVEDATVAFDISTPLVGEINTREEPKPKVRAESGSSMIEDVGVLAMLGLSPEWEWSEAENLGPLVNGSGNDATPSLSSDGLELFFASEDASGVVGGWDIASSRRDTLDTPWKKAQSLGRSVCKSHAEWSPAISPDGLTLMFTSNPRERLFVTKRTRVGRPWSKAIPLEAITVGMEAAGPAFSEDGKLLFFMSYNGSHYVNYFTTLDSDTMKWSSPLRSDTIVQGTPISGDFSVRACLTNADILITEHNGRGNVMIHLKERNQLSWRPGIPATGLRGIAIGLSYSSMAGEVVFQRPPEHGGHGGNDIWSMKLKRGPE